MQNLTQLVHLSLGANQVSDILPLVNNIGLDVGDEIWLHNNPLSQASIEEYIPALEDRGVEVDY